MHKPCEELPVLVLFALLSVFTDLFFDACSFLQLDQPGGGCLIETWDCTLALYWCRYRFLSQSLSSLPCLGGGICTGFKVVGLILLYVFPDQKFSWSLQSEGKGWSCLSSLSLLLLLGQSGWAMSIKSASQSIGFQMHLVFLEMHVWQYSSKLWMCRGMSVSESLSTYVKILGGYPIP